MVEGDKLTTGIFPPDVANRRINAVVASVQMIFASAAALTAAFGLKVMPFPCLQIFQFIIHQSA